MVISPFGLVWLYRYQLGAAVAVAALLGGLLLLSSRERGGDPRSAVAAALAAQEATSALLDANRPEDAEEICRQAIVALDGQIARQPRFRELRRGRAEVLDTIGRIQRALDQAR